MLCGSVSAKSKQQITGSQNKKLLRLANKILRQTPWRLQKTRRPASFQKNTGLAGRHRLRVENVKQGVLVLLVLHRAPRAHAPLMPSIRKIQRRFRFPQKSPSHLCEASNK
jgi:hypothetical protein